jgi:hypothetical protein
MIRTQTLYYSHKVNDFQRNRHERHATEGRPLQYLLPSCLQPYQMSTVQSPEAVATLLKFVYFNFIYCLFNDAVNTSDYTAKDNRMIN